MTPPDPSSQLPLPGPDAANPLGFLSVLGTAAIAADFCPALRLSWRLEPAGWRAVLHGCGDDMAAFIERLDAALQAASMAAFEIDDKLPFEAGKFRDALRTTQARSMPDSRRDVDFLAAFGSELYVAKTGEFQTSRFRMTRSGDSSGQGLPAYARLNRRVARVAHLERVLMSAWDYRDQKFSLRWDPLEDQRYALRWRNPAESSAGEGPGTMHGANSLAVEALRLFPVMPNGSHPVTTGFVRFAHRSTQFCWPIWTAPLSLDVIRSVLTLPALSVEAPDHNRLRSRGIEVVYRSQRIQPNQYYSNFTPGVPV